MEALPKMGASCCACWRPRPRTIQPLNSPSSPMPRSYSVSPYSEVMRKSRKPNAQSLVTADAAVRLKPLTYERLQRGLSARFCTAAPLSARPMEMESPAEGYSQHDPGRDSCPKVSTEAGLHVASRNCILYSSVTLHTLIEIILNRVNSAEPVCHCRISGQMFVM
jgi:hypothetical protein